MLYFIIFLLLFCNTVSISAHLVLIPKQNFIVLVIYILMMLYIFFPQVLIVGDENWSVQILNWLDNAECKQRLVTGYEDAGTNFTAFQPHYVILDLGIPEPNQTLRYPKNTTNSLKI